MTGKKPGCESLSLTARIGARLPSICAPRRAPGRRSSATARAVVTRKRSRACLHCGTVCHDHCLPGWDRNTDVDGDGGRRPSTPAPQEQAMLVLTRRIGEVIVIAGNVQVTVVAVQGSKVRLGVTAPDGVTVDRKEVHQRREQFAGSEQQAEAAFSI